MSIKKQLESAILRELEGQGKNQKVIAERFGVHQCDVSALRRGVSSSIISTDKMITLAAAFGIGFKVEIIKIEPVPMTAVLSSPVVLEDMKGVF